MIRQTTRTTAALRQRGKEVASFSENTRNEGSITIHAVRGCDAGPDRSPQVDISEKLKTGIETGDLPKFAIGARLKSVPPLFGVYQAMVGNSDETPKSDCNAAEKDKENQDAGQEKLTRFWRPGVQPGELIPKQPASKDNAREQP
eukprot:6178422-Pleurochrysis_carterae.AAC.1